MLYTLAVFIISSGTPINYFEVHGYHSLHECLEGRKTSQKMSINPLTQKVSATCVPASVMEKVHKVLIK